VQRRPRDNREAMGRKKLQPEEESHDPFARWRSIQLTAAQKAELRARAEERAAEARRKGVYEKILGLIGKVHLDMDDLREARKSKR
jgi:hypothetical protein